MRFANPMILHLLWLLPVLAAALHLLYHYRKGVASRFVQAQLLEETVMDLSLLRARLKAILMMMAFVFFVFALARPQWGYKLADIKRHGLDILIAIDTSKSMLTADVKPSRLERTKLAVKDLVKKLKGDRIGLVAFAGDAFLICPLTTDYNGFLMSLNDMNVDTIPRGGTDIAKAIDEALKGYGDTHKEYKTVILVTDGEEVQGDVLKAANRAKDKKVKVYAVGVGTQEGDLIQVTNEQGEKEFLKDAQGNFVKSRLNENLLQQIAYTTGASYVRGGGAQFGLDYLYEQQLSKLDKRDIDEKKEKKYHERYQWPLFLGFLCLLFESLISTRRNFTFSFLRRRESTMLVILCIGLLIPSVSLASSGAQVREGNRNFKQGKFDAAIKNYEKAANPKKPLATVDYNLGSAYYKNGDYAKAREYLKKAVTAQDKVINPLAEYNLGNTLYKDALLKENTDLGGAIADLEQSIISYSKVLADFPKDSDAAYNKALAQQQLERLKQQQQQQQKQDQEKDQEKNQEQDKQEDKKQNNEQKENKQDEQQNKQQSQDQSKEEQQKQESEKKKQEQENKKQGQQDQDQGKEDKDKQNEQAQEAMESIEQKQAKELLEDYERNEQPVRMLQFITNSVDEKAVGKDW